MANHKAATAAPRTVTVGERTFTLLFPDLLPELSERERTDLRENIRRNGVITPIIVDEHDGVIDGAHRVTFAVELGLPVVPVEVRRGLTPERKIELAYSLNEDRRQMDPATIKRLKAARVERVAAARREGKSIRTIAEEAGVSKSQVERDLQEAKSTVPGGTVELPKGKVKGKDGKARPATRKVDRSHKNVKGRKPVRESPAPSAGAPSGSAAATSPGDSSYGGGGLDGVLADLESLGGDQSALAAARFVAASLLGETAERWRAIWLKIVTVKPAEVERFEASLALELEGAAARKNKVDAAAMALAVLGEGARVEDLKQWVAGRWPDVRLRLKDVNRARARLRRAADRR
jgi:ParB-like chromosome segregation protein Spo0J